MNKFKIIIFSVLVLGIVSCSKDFLDVKPKGRVIASRVSDYDKLFEQSMFAQFTSSGTSLDAQYILGDDVAGLEPHYSNPAYFGSSGTRRHNLFEWKKDAYRADERTEEVSALYERIYTTNKVINEVMTAEDGTNAFKSQLRAEGLCQRAFAYFMLINYFGKPYNEKTAPDDPGVPIILNNDFSIKNFQRSSVQEVYDLIVDDLKNAIPDLPLEQVDANRFTKSAAEALLGKVYIFMARPELAVPQLDYAVDNLPARFKIGGVVEFINYNTASAGNPLIGYAFVNPNVGSTAAQGHGYPETLQAQAGITLWNGNSAALIISPETYALYKASDLRKKLFVNTYSPLSPGSGPLLPAGLYRSRAGFLGSSLGIQLPDIYLLRAEAKARTNDVTGARENLLVLRRNRMPNEDAEAGIPETKDELIRFIIDERQREFATLGFRWFDMRRLSNDPLFGNTNFKHVVFDETGNVKATFNFNSDRFMLRFSEKLMDESPGLVNNP